VSDQGGPAEEGGALDRTQSDLRAALGGDDEARGELLERLRPRLVLWAASRLSPELRRHHEPEDVAQEILLAVHRSLDSFEDRGKRAFHGWLFRIAENRIRDLATREGAQKRQPVAILPFTQTSPSVAAVRAESFRLLHEAIATLSASHQAVIRLLRFEERSVEEAARLLERSENAVRILYCRALKALREAYPGDV
jgi:RNA polymerase sigma-70 factor (ECF subfamily)